MDFLKKIVEQPAFKTRIKSNDVKIQEIALGYFLAPFCAMLPAHGAGIPARRFRYAVCSVETP